LETITEAQAQTPKAARWEDFVDIFISPADVFRRRADESWVVPWVIVSVVAVLLFYVFLPASELIMEAAMRDQMANAAASGNAMNTEAMKKMAGTMQVLGGILVPIGLLLQIVAVGALLWAGVKLTGGDVGFKRALLIVAYSEVIGLIAQVVVSLLVILKSNAGGIIEMVPDTSLGVLRFVPTDAVPPILVPLLKRIDIFQLWTMALWAIGLEVLAKCTKAQAWGVAVAASILWAVPETMKALFTKAPGSA
jgi:hypothetical protein